MPRKCSFKEVKKPILVIANKKIIKTYLNQLNIILRLNHITIKPKFSTKYSNLDILRTAIKESKDSNSYEIFCFLDFTNNTDLSSNLIKELKKAINSGIFPIMTKPCFEIWFMSELKTISYNKFYKVDCIEYLKSLLTNYQYNIWVKMNTIRKILTNNLLINDDLPNDKDDFSFLTSPESDSDIFSLFKTMVSI